MSLVSYDELKLSLCNKEDKISNDLMRSFNDYPFYKENVSFEREFSVNNMFLQRAEKINILHQILRAYANLDPEVGYTQGLTNYESCIVI